jgi:hypothetical protein
LLLVATIEKEKSLSLQIEDPFHVDLNAFIQRIEKLASSEGIKNIRALDLSNTIRSMIKGIAGCERGCPADAKGLVSAGVEGFDLEYIEGGILSATARLVEGKSLNIKAFPDF